MFVAYVKFVLCHSYYFSISTTAVDKFVPQYSKKSSRFPTWMNRSCRRAWKHKSNMWKRFTQCKTSANFQCYKKLRTKRLQSYEIAPAMNSRVPTGQGKLKKGKVRDDIFWKSQGKVRENEKLVLSDVRFSG